MVLCRLHLADTDFMSATMRLRVSSPLLIGRDQELSVLSDFVANLRFGEPAVALVSGRAGSGKTRLISEFRTRVPHKRAQFLIGSSLPLDAGGPPYLPLHAALRPALPPGTPILDALSGTNPINRTQLFEGLRSTIEALAKDDPLLLVMEDMHWADRATQDALLYLVTQATHGRWGLIVTIRPEGLASAAGLATLLERRPVLHLPLGTMSVTEVSEQMSAITGVAADAGEAALVHRRSGGVPLFVEEVLAAGTGRVPDHLRAMFLSRVRALGEAVADVVNASAVVDRGSDEGVLAQILEARVETVRVAARSAVEWDLLAVDESGYRVRHDLLREAVYDALPPALRRALHARAARVLSSPSGIEPAELAHHWHRAGDATQAAKASLEAAELAELAHAPRSAYLQLERVLSLWSSLDSDLQQQMGGRAAILRRAAVSAERSGSFDAAIALTEERLPYCQPADLALVWEGLGRYRWQGGDGLGSQAAYETAVKVLQPEAPAAVRAKVLSGYAWHLAVADQSEKAVEISRQARVAGRGIRDASVRWQVLLSWGVARLGQEDAHRALKQARDLAASLDEGYDVAISDLWLNASLRILGRSDECEELLRAGLQHAAAHGLRRSVEAVLLYLLAERLMEVGRWDEAAAALDINQRLQVGGMPGYFSAAYRARLAAFRGNHVALVEEVADTLAQSVAIPQQTLPPAIALLAQAEQHLWADDSEDATRSALEALSLAESDLYYRANALAIVARAEADAAGEARLHGRQVALRVQPDELLHRAAIWEVPTNMPVCAYILTARAEVGRLEGSRDPSSWRQAVTAWLTVGDPYHLAYARWRLGWALLRSRSGRAEATKQLQLAHESASTLGAKPLLAAIEAQAATSKLRVGTQSGRTAGSVAALELGLTSRELEVLPLVVAGRTNAEIAQILVISPRTVGEHVSRILHKLDATRRTEAADIARRAGLLDS